MIDWYTFVLALITLVEVNCFQQFFSVRFWGIMRSYPRIACLGCLALEILHSLYQDCGLKPLEVWNFTKFLSYKPI